MRPEDAPRPGNRGADAQSTERGDERCQCTRAPAPYVSRSYRVTWRRPHWSDATGTESRPFERAADAARFRDRLEADGARTFLECRPVGRWEPCVGEGCR